MDRRVTLAYHAIDPGDDLYIPGCSLNSIRHGRRAEHLVLRYNQSPDTESRFPMILIGESEIPKSGSTFVLLYDFPQCQYGLHPSFEVHTFSGPVKASFVTVTGSGRGR